MTTKLTPRSLLIPLFAVTIVLTSCERPELNGKKEANTQPGMEEPSAAAPEVTATVKEKETNAVPQPASRPEERPEPAYPELAVYRDGEKIVIEGALKSRMQVSRIAEEMERDFPKATIENRLKVESHRYPVGWGNRVTLTYLVPFFHEVEDPHVAYEEGVVTLKGKVKRGGIRKFQELAVNVFAGMHLKDIRNEMVETAP